MYVQSTLSLPEALKVCTECGRPKPLDAFGKSSEMRSGLKSACRECQNARARKFYRDHPDKVRAWQLRYREENKDRIRAYGRAYWRANADRKAAYYQANAERYRELRRASDQRNSDRALARVHRRRARRRNAPVVERYSRSDVFAMYGETCYLCDAALTVETGRELDHVIPLARGGEESVRNLRPCCSKCNYRKGARLWTDLRDSQMSERVRDIAETLQ